MSVTTDVVVRKADTALDIAGVDVDSGGLTRSASSTIGKSHDDGPCTRGTPLVAGATDAVPFTFVGTSSSCSNGAT